MQKTQIKLGLFDPGMTHLHRVGLAGLYMILESLKNQNLSFENAAWHLDPTTVVLEFDEQNGYAFFDWLFSHSFQIDNNGLIRFPHTQLKGMGDLERISYYKCIMNTFLQHTKTNAKDTQITQTYDYQSNKKVTVDYTPLKWFYLQGKKPDFSVKSTSPALDILFENNKLKSTPIKIKGLHFPGAVERHSGLSGTEMEQSIYMVLSLLYACTGVLYYQIKRKDQKGEPDDKYKHAIVLPHIENLHAYAKGYQRYLTTPYRRLTANSSGDAALLGLIELKAQADIYQIGVSGCSVLLIGKAKWNKNQKVRTCATSFNHLIKDRILQFEIASKCLQNREFFPEIIKKESGSRMSITTSLVRGLVADNLASGKQFYHNFYQLLLSQKLTQFIEKERKGLNEMIQKMTWSFEEDKLLVEAIHAALKSRYGKLAEQAKKSGESIYEKFNREYERIRTSLVRAKNLQTLRAEIATIFARGHRNFTLQKNWTTILPLFTGPDWQRTRDLALLALASYSGSSEENKQSTHEDNLELEEEE